MKVLIRSVWLLFAISILIMLVSCLSPRKNADVVNDYTDYMMSENTLSEKNTALSESDVQKIKLGMTRSEVFDIIGKTGLCKEYNSDRPLIYEWNIENGDVLYVSFWSDDYDEFYEKMQNGEFILDEERDTVVYDSNGIHVATPNEQKALNEWTDSTKVINITRVAAKKKIETSEQAEISVPNEETQEVTEPVQTEPNEPKEDYIVLFPEEFSEEMRKAVEENDLRDIVWVANVNGRYLGITMGEAELVDKKTGYGYTLSFPNGTCIWAFDTESNFLSGLGPYSSKVEKDSLEEFLSEEEVKVLYDNLPTYFQKYDEQMFGKNK